MLLRQRGHCSNTQMSAQHGNFIPARISSGKTRSALAAKTQGGSVKLAMGRYGDFESGFGECWYYERS